MTQSRWRGTAAFPHRTGALCAGVRRVMDSACDPAYCRGMPIRDAFAKPMKLMMSRSAASDVGTRLR